MAIISAKAGLFEMKRMIQAVRMHIFNPSMAAVIQNVDIGRNLLNKGQLEELFLSPWNCNVVLNVLGSYY